MKIEIIIRGTVTLPILLLCITSYLPNTGFCQPFEVVSALPGTATFDGPNSMYLRLQELGVYRGYLGSFSGDPADVDFGTGIGNDNGKLHLTIEAAPKVTLDHDGDLGIHNTAPAVDLVVHQRQAANAGPDALVQNPSGLMIEAPDNSAALLYIDASNDLNFAFGAGILTTQRAFIDNVTGDYVNTSDRRLKENIQSLHSVLPRLLRLKPSSYNFKNTPSDKSTMGFIAQEVQDEFPEMVHEKNGVLALAYDKFAVLAIKAIQEQQKIIEQMSASIRELKQIRN